MNAQPKPLRGHQPDYVLALGVFVLLALGLVMMYSISPVLSYKLLGSTTRNYYFFGQMLNIAVGLVGWIVAAKIDYRRWRKLSPLLMLVAVVMLLLLLVPGLSITEKGATRWLKLGPASFQPAELAKLAAILYLAVWFERRKEAIRTFWDGLVPFAVMLAAISFVIVVLQRDMGTMLVLALATSGIYFVAGGKLSHLMALATSALALVWLAIISFPHRVERLSTFLDPSKDPTGQGYHIGQALIAIGSGGIWGLGLGKSIQIYGYLPEAANDSIFAIIAEEFGLLGALVVLGLFGLLAYRGFKIARAAPDSFARLTAVGISLWLFFQAIINIAAMLSLVPLTGIPLPFISYGGSSMLLSLIGTGILLNISKYTIEEVRHAHSGERGRNGWTHFAVAGNGRRVKVARTGS
ncbi:putative lipid II flippase FtsW [Candidatus Parcubacteria bacterium]|nr:putative lipid II flippase FtsW [Candidatus Parcubacteria bacterium]